MQQKNSTDRPLKISMAFPVKPLEQESAPFNLLVYLFVLMWCVFSCDQSLYAKDKKTPLLRDNPTALIDYLEQEKQFLNTAINETKQYPSPKDQKDFNTKTEEIDASLTIVDAKTDSLNSFLDNEKKTSVDLSQKLKYLQQLPTTDVSINIEERVAKTESLLTINNKTMDLINENIELAQQFKTVLVDEVHKLKIWKEHDLLEQKLLNIKEKKLKIEEQLFNLYQTSSSNNKNNPTNRESNLIYNQEKSLINSQYIALFHHEINLLTIEKNTIKADSSVLTSSDAKTIQNVVDFYKDSLSQLTTSVNSLQQLRTTLQKESLFIRNMLLKKSLDSLQMDLTKKLDYAQRLKTSLNLHLDNYQQRVKKLISTRQSLAEYNINSWPFIMNKLLVLPGQVEKYIQTLAVKVYDSYNWLNLIAMAFLWLSLGIIVLLYSALSRFLRSLPPGHTKARSLLTGYLFDGFLVLIQRNIPLLCLISLLRVTFLFTSISYVNYQLVINLLTVWLTFRSLILIAKLALLERLSDVSGKDVKLYYRLKWLFLFGGWATALMVIGHVLSLAVILQDIFNRLFMLFILTISLVSWKSKDVIPYLLEPFLHGKRRYIKNAAALLMVLMPITLCTTAIIGLMGFVNLAWTLSGYEAYTLLLIVGYILVRGLLADGLELLSEAMIRSMRNGWLWIEIFLKPIDKIVRIVLLLSGIVLLFQIFGWNSDSVVMMNLNRVAHYTLIDSPGIYITLISIIEFFIVLSIFIWATKWTREFGYRWLYKNAKDIAIRNSLSIFTQYAIILLGAFVTLHILGFDLSGMSVVLGGLAVGMGFGLRDFASNIIGGVMLLIERPVREGDLITIGEHEGKVEHIGIRTMRLSSWDNMEVLIPNAETFNKPFTNWTFQDSIVRTVLPIKVCRSDDPTLVQELITKVLSIIPEIVPDPPFQVFLKKIDEALFEFEVRYFINVQTYSRVEVKSNVLFAIIEQFKASGIKPPVEPLAIEIKERHSSDVRRAHTNEPS